jgi:hypothetical protein
MTVRITPGLQLSDLLVYLLTPVVAFLLPASISRRLVDRVARWNWVLRSEADASFANAAKYTRIEDEQEWKRRWRTVVLLDARDLYLLTWGRSNAVLTEISGRERIVEARDRVIVGMHWGPAIAILKLLQSQDMRPLLVYRKVEKDILRLRPFYYFFLRKAIRYIESSCGDRAIPVRGASDALRRSLPMAGTSIVVLDAPPTPGRSTLGGTVLGWPVRFNAGFPDILNESGRMHHFFAISLQPGPEALKILELTEPRPAGTAGALIRDYCAFLERHLEADSAQWRIWQVADQFFGSSNETGEPTTGRAAP